MTYEIFPDFLTTKKKIIFGDKSVDLAL